MLAVVGIAILTCSGFAEDTGKARVAGSYGSLPLAFEENRGQGNAEIRYMARGAGYALFLADSGAVIKVRSGGDCAQTETPAPRKPEACSAGADTLRLQLEGAAREVGHAAQANGEEELPGKVNYFIGNDASKWRRDLPTYAKVRYRQVYPGIDLVYYGKQGRLEYDFVIAAGADAGVIRMRFAGGRLREDRKGNLVVKVGETELAFDKPALYQEIDGKRVAVDGSFVLSGASGLGFRVGAYDRSKPLVIDPVLVYSTYLGGSGSGTGTNAKGDRANGIVLDSLGSAYVVGTTYSADFPVTTGAFQSANNVAAAGHGSTVFVSKFNADGTALVYSTYVGGSGATAGGDFGYGIALDPSNNAYITGATYSTDFPVTCQSYRSINPSRTPGATTGFVTKLNGAGDGLIYSTYLGGTGNMVTQSPGGDVAQAIAVDATGSAYVTGYTYSSTFPVTGDAFQTQLKGGPNAFVTKLSPVGVSAVYSTYIGGSGGDYGNAIAIDAAGDAFVGGGTGSGDYPVSSGAFQTTNPGFSGFVTEVNPTGEALVYSSFIGGGADAVEAIAVDGAGFVYLAGNTASKAFPVTPGVVEGSALANSSYFQQGGVGSIGFVSKMNTNGTALVYSTYLEGAGTSVAGLGVDATGAAYVVGSAPTAGTGFFGGFKEAADARSVPAGSNSAFVVKLNPTATVLNYARLVGGSSVDGATALALDGAGNAYVTGYAASTDFPTTSGVFQTANKATNGGGNAFVSKLALGSAAHQVTYPAPAVAVPTTITVVSAQVACEPGWPGYDVFVTFNVIAGNGGTPISGTPITGGMAFTGNFNVGEYGEPVYGDWSGVATVSVDGNSSDQYAPPDSVSWTAQYLGDSIYQGSTLNGSTPTPADCVPPPPDSAVRARAARNGISRASGAGVTKAAGVAAANTGDLTAARLIGAKFVPESRTGMTAVSDSGRDAVRQATAACIAPAQEAQASAPIASPSGGKFASAQTVTLTDSTYGALIYYTTNTEPPSAASTLYTGPFSVGATTTVRAVAVVNGYKNSAGLTEVYTIDATRTAAPIFSPGTGFYPAVQMVSITDATPGAAIYYTTDGSVPTSSSLLYTGPILVSANTVIKAVAIAGGLTDSSSWALYTLVGSPWALAAPATNVAAGAATLNAVVKPGPVTGSYFFRYGTRADITALRQSTSQVSLAASNVPLDVSAQIGSLVPGTQYYYQVVVETEGGTSLGAILGFVAK
jgi:hypothetical protein